MTDHTTDTLAELEQAETAGRAAAATRYWHTVGELADEETGAAPPDVSSLRDDLRELGIDTAQMKKDVKSLRRLRASALDDGDPVPGAREAVAKSKGRVKAAHAKLEEAKLVLKAAEAESQKARWESTAAQDGVRTAILRNRQRVESASEMAKGLLKNGMPRDLLPAFCSRAEEPPAKIPHRVLKKTFHDNQMRETGDVVEHHERVTNDVLRPIRDGEPATAIPPRWRVKVTQNHRDEVDAWHRGAGKMLMAGDVLDVTIDPIGNPCLALVADDTPLGLGRGVPQEQEEQNNGN